MTLTKEHLEVMLALAAGRQHRWLWERPMLRRTLVGSGMIVSAGPRTAPREDGDPAPARRPFVLTTAGRGELVKRGLIAEQQGGAACAP